MGDLPKELFASAPPKKEYEKPKTFGDLVREQATDLFVANDAMPRALKAAFIGLNGSGKTLTMALLAIGISKTYHKGAPVMMHDSEDPASDFLVPIFKKENIEFLRRKSISFKDTCAGIAEAQRKGACVYIEDSMTKDWNELLESFKKSYNPPLAEIEMWHWARIKPTWNEDWVNPMLASPVHVLIGGRLGDRWEEVTKADGKDRVEVVDSKMKAEGEFGHEPSMLIEMHSDRGSATKLVVTGRKRKRSGGDTIHTAFVKKDRSRTIQGKTCEWPAINDYKVGDWKKVFEFFEPHLKLYDIAGSIVAPEAAPTPSNPLFAGGNGAYHQRKQDAQIALEEIEAALTTIWPGATSGAKALKLLALDTLFGTRSWTKVTSLPQAELDAGLIRLRTIERNTKNAPMDDEAVVIQVLNEAMGKEVVPTQIDTGKTEAA
jgi:hypothetical protein